MRLIDADRLVDMLYDNEFATLCPLDEVSGVVDACPTVDAVPVVHGRWIERKTGEGRKYYECSACGRGENRHTAIRGRYCWACGTKMDGDADG